MNGGGVFLSSSVRRRGDRFFPGTLFQDRLRRPAAGEAGKKNTLIRGTHLIRGSEVFLNFKYIEGGPTISHIYQISQLLPIRA